MFDNNGNPRLEEIIARCRRAEAEGGTLDAGVYAEDIRHLITRQDCAEGQCADLVAEREDDRLRADLLNVSALLPWRAYGPG
jgi:hypothetical protein